MFAYPLAANVHCCAQALEAMKTAKLPRVYYDFLDQLKTNPAGTALQLERQQGRVQHSEPSCMYTGTRAPGRAAAPAYLFNFC